MTPNCLKFHPCRRHRFVGCVALLLWLPISAQAGDEKIREAARKSLIDAEFVKALTPDDVPDDWKCVKVIDETKGQTVLTYSRKGSKRLSVIWTDDWTGEKEKRFSALVYEGDKKLFSIARFNQETTVFPPDGEEGYRVITAVKEDGSMTVTILDKNGGFMDVIVVDGRNTRLIEDLEYTKAALSIGAMEPILNALKGALEKSEK